VQYRIDKKSGNNLSILGFGGMRFPRAFGRIDILKTEEILMHSIEEGLNYFDTAWIYPGSEEALGVIFERNHVREKVFIASKLPLLMLKSKTDFDKYFDQSLERLKTNYIDYYLMHMLMDMDQWTKLKNMGIEDWIANKKKSGQIRQIGFSFHGTGDEYLKILDDYDWECSLIQYNYADENFQAGVTGLRAAAARMPVMIMEPLLGGRLADALPKDAVKIFKNANPNLSPAGWALNWVWNQSEVTLLLSGMSCMEQLDENMRLADTAAAGMFADREKSVIKDVLESVNRACKIRCTGCNYCMPCPLGVNIPGSFSAYNMMYSIGYFTGMRQFIFSVGVLSEKGNSPSLCVKCGKCESHCPQHLPIIKDLAKVRRRMEPFWIKFIGACARAYLGKKRKKANA
jgi:predicted aldo/keto reductase-like oxidoreductase